jgi:hypothetical protein
MKPTEAQIQKEITKLTAMKPTIRPYSMFGDDNRASIQAQIDVLSKNLDEDDISERWDPETELDIYDSAYEAYQWLNGESEYKTLTENWESLVVEKSESKPTKRKSK